MTSLKEGGDNIEIVNNLRSPAFRFLRVLNETEDRFVEEAIKTNRITKISTFKFLKVAAGFVILILISILIIRLQPDKREPFGNYNEIVVVDENTSYTGYSNYKTALNDAKYVLYGTVQNIGEGYRVNIGEDFGYVSYEYYTPIEIKVINCIKGDINGNTIIYNALGAEYEGIRYEYSAFDTFSLKYGDKILVFLSERNDCISIDCIVTEKEDGYASKPDLKYKNEFLTIEEHVQIIEEEYNNMLKNTVTE